VTFWLTGNLVVAPPSWAAEYGWGHYLLGVSVPMSGYTPPPGVYFSDTVWFYNGSASGNIRFPFGRTVDAGISEKFAIDAATLSWFTDAKFLGGTLGFAATLPFGADKNSATAEFTGPLGITRAIGRSESVTGLGDVAISGILGWQQGDHHWNVTVTDFLATGLYNASSLAFIGLNRPSVDIKGGYTYLDLQTGHEISVALGVTFNGTNPATDYTTGTELHFEWALNQHFASGFSLGAGGYFYDQVSGDSGSGDHVGPFEGRVVSIGPLVGYTFKAGETPVTLGGRWFTEFDVQNRVTGNSVFASLSLPLYVSSPPTPLTTK
jgi:hypothetical protein